MNGIIFDIKRYAIHDGPGIRTTVFFKGCPLRCRWCHNPEGIDPDRELMIWMSRCSPGCTDCLKACPRKALVKTNRVLRILPERCDLCGVCEETCMYDAIQVVGRAVSSEDLMAEIAKDRIFFETSGGGVTFSGGEPLMQPEFLLELLDRCSAKGIRTTVDTSGSVPYEVLEAVSQKSSLILFDLKMMDSEKHKEFTGKPNADILENLKRLSTKGKKLIIRIPLIRGVNDDEENIVRTGDFLMTCGPLQAVHLLPYHSGGEEKRRRLRKPLAGDGFEPPSPRTVAGIKERLRKLGFSVKIGG
ncbi:MAG: glycyl-radical enzyme activating protein [Candidatus Aminicenantales bacterium]